MKIKEQKLLQIDPYLEPFSEDLGLRAQLYLKKRAELVGDSKTLSAFADGYKYFGFHRTRSGWVYREWAPAADEMYLTGDFNGWNIEECPLKRLENGVFEVELKGRDALKAGQKVQVVVISSGQILRRIPTYATRVVQDPVTYLWCAEIEDTFAKFPWTDKGFKPNNTPFIYECHIGMAQEKGAVGTYKEFRENILPRINEMGYNTIQIMAVMEHPYYASFG
ncbi:MAG: 1,4-alpha-glucan-branching enzyme, partial [Acutalibacteraceae bacterium]|nr:1,4-alpha-glucan-branching enzyme [Acutalibacteraceae bacterium]